MSHFLKGPLWRHCRRSYSKIPQALHENYYDKYLSRTRPETLAAEGIRVNLGLKLCNLIKLEKFRALSPETINDIWNSHHTTKPQTYSLCIDKSPFREWWGKRAGECPNFLVPLVTPKGFHNYVVQNIGQQDGDGIAIFTALDDFQKYGEASPVRLVAYCFSDLLESKNLGLIKATFDTNLLSREHAESIIKTCINFYSTPLYSWVRDFNLRPESFDFETFLIQVKKSLATRPQ